MLHLSIQKAMKQRVCVSNRSQQIGLGCASCYALYTIPHPKTFDMNLCLPSQQKLSCELVQLGKFVFKGSLMTPNKQRLQSTAAPLRWTHHKALAIPKIKSSGRLSF